MKGYKFTIKQISQSQKALKEILTSLEKECVTFFHCDEICWGTVVRLRHRLSQFNVRVQCCELDEDGCFEVIGWDEAFRENKKVVMVIERNN